MKWWDIIKNQIASTKGKTFQLDFSEPMIEDEETCKEKFRAILDKFWELDFKQFFLKDFDFSLNSYTSPTYKVNEGNNWEDSVEVVFTRSSSDSNAFEMMPEEVACWFLENLKQEASETFMIENNRAKANVFVRELESGMYLYALWFEARIHGGVYSFHTSIRVNTPSFGNNELFKRKAKNYVDFEKLDEAIRNIIG